MRFIQLILAIALVITTLTGFSQKNVSENETKYFCSFLDSMSHPAFTFTHSEFVGIVELAKQLNRSKLPLRFRHFSLRSAEGNAENLTFEYESNSNTDFIRKGKYSMILTLRNDSLVDEYYQYPPDVNAKTVGTDILEIYMDLIQYDNNFYRLQAYGNDAFKEGMQMPVNYRELLNDFFVSDSGVFNSKKIDRFVFYQSDEFDGQYWIELFVDKKSKKIKSFGALKYY